VRLSRGRGTRAASRPARPGDKVLRIEQDVCGAVGERVLELYRRLIAAQSAKQFAVRTADLAG
jgi:hypothetical protein